MAKPNSRKARRRRRYLAAWSELQGGCYLCGKPGRVKSVDHVKPLSKKGSDRILNKLGTCTPCNKRKGDRLPHPCELIYRDAFYLLHRERFFKLADIPLHTYPTRRLGR